MKPMMGAEENDMDEMYRGSEGGESEGDTETIDQEEQEEMADKAVVPMKVLMGKHTEPLKVGDEVVLRVDAIHGDQAEVSYSETPPGEIGEGENPPGSEMSPEEELDGMDKGAY